MTRSDRFARCAAAALPALLLAACAAPAPALRELRGAWRIEQARTEPIYDKRLARLDFHPDGTLSGHTSCNRLSGRYQLDGDRLAVGHVATTRSACPRLQMEQEDRILSALEAAHTARVRADGLLELRDEDGRGVLRATRWSDAP